MRVKKQSVLSGALSIYYLTLDSLPPIRLSHTNNILAKGQQLSKQNNPRHNENETFLSHIMALVETCDHRHYRQ